MYHLAYLVHKVSSKTSIIIIIIYEQLIAAGYPSDREIIVMVPNRDINVRRTEEDDVNSRRIRVICVRLNADNGYIIH